MYNFQRMYLCNGAEHKFLAPTNKHEFWPSRACYFFAKKLFHHHTMQTVNEFILNNPHSQEQVERFKTLSSPQLISSKHHFNRPRLVTLQLFPFFTKSDQELKGLEMSGVTSVGNYPSARDPTISEHVRKSLIVNFSQILQLCRAEG